MRKLFTAVITVFSILFFQTYAANAQVTLENSSITPPTRTIGVSGNAEVRAVPDQVMIYMTAETRNKNLIEAKEENDKTISSLINFTSNKLEIEKKDIQTDNINIEPIYQRCDYHDELRGACNPLKIIYYRVSKGIQIRLNDVEKYDDIITAALNYGVTNIDNVQFITTELRKHRDQAREMAAKASLEKAQAIAKTLNMEIGKPITLTSHNAYSYFGSNMNSHDRGTMQMQNVMIQNESPTGGPSEETGGLALGLIKITATVNATYEMK